MNKKRSEIEMQLFELGYPIISGFVTNGQYPLGRIEKGIIYPELISPKQIIEKKGLEGIQRGMLKILEEKEFPYRLNGKIIIGQQEVPWEEYRKSRR